MKILDIKKTFFSEVLVIKFARFKDNRGYFTETFRESDFKKIISDFRILQINESHSKKGVIRGLHFQWNPYMGKLVRTVKGHMVDLFLDVRKGSPTLGKIAVYDMPENPDNDYGEWIWIPVGFAHGNFYLQDSTIEYLCTAEYSPGNEVGISPLVNDIDWSICDKNVKKQFEELNKQGFIISDKDKNGLSVEDWKKDPRANNFIYK